MAANTDQRVCTDDDRIEQRDKSSKTESVVSKEDASIYRSHESHVSKSDYRTVVEKRYQYKQRLGSGTYGYVGKHFDIVKQEYVAIKSQPFEKEIGFERHILREIDILSRIFHPRIIDIKDVYTLNEKIYMVMPYCDESLHRLCRLRISNGLIKKIMFQLLDSIEFLNRNGIYHCDIKTQNVVLDKHYNSYLIDFGLCNVDGLDRQCAAYTAYARAPELYLGFSPWTCINKTTEMWALGCLFWEMCTCVRFSQNYQYRSTYLKEVMEKLGVVDEHMASMLNIPQSWKQMVQENGNIAAVSMFKYNPELDTDLAEITMSLLKFYPEDRATAEDLLKLPCFSSFTRSQGRIETCEPCPIPHSIYEKRYPYMTQEYRIELFTWLEGKFSLGNKFDIAFINAIHMFDSYIYENNVMEEEIKLILVICYYLVVSYTRGNADIISFWLKKADLSDTYTTEDAYEAQDSIFRHFGYQVCVESITTKMADELGVKEPSYFHINAAFETMTDPKYMGYDVKKLAGKIVRAISVYDPSVSKSQVSETLTPPKVSVLMGCQIDISNNDTNISSSNNNSSNNALKNVSNIINNLEICNPNIPFVDDYSTNLTQMRKLVVS